MVCPYCRHETQVINSRPQKRANHIWRRRQCQGCENIFTTHELIDLSTALRIRYTPTDLRPFNKDALFISIYESCRYRPTAIEDAAALTQTTVAMLVQAAQQGIIERNEIIDTTAAVLKRFDNTAATMYKAYHKK